MEVGIEDVLKLLEANPLILITVALPLSLFAVVKLVGALSSGNKNSAMQIQLEQKLVEFAGQSIETTKLLKIAYEDNTGIQQEMVDKLEKISVVLDNLLSKVDASIQEAVKENVTPVSEAVEEINKNLIRNATTRVVVRGNNGKIITSFVARPHKLPNGEQILLIDISSNNSKGK